MLIKVINNRRATPRRPTDLRRLMGYLLTPQMSKEPLPSPPRLLGPPFLNGLITSHLPWGLGVDAAVADMAEQMVDYCRARSAGKDMPDAWYAHVIFSFAPKASGDLRVPPDPHASPPKARSQAQNALRLTFDALDFLGWSAAQPGLFVVHGDRQHIHVHGALATPVRSTSKDNVWGVMRMSRRQLWEISTMCREAFGLPEPDRVHADEHHKRWIAL